MNCFNYPIGTILRKAMLTILWNPRSEFAVLGLTLWIRLFLQWMSLTMVKSISFKMSNTYPKKNLKKTRNNLQCVPYRLRWAWYDARWRQWSWRCCPAVGGTPRTLCRPLFWGGRSSYWCVHSSPRRRTRTPPARGNLSVVQTKHCETGADPGFTCTRQGAECSKYICKGYGNVYSESEGKRVILEVSNYIR